MQLVGEYLQKISGGNGSMHMIGFISRALQMTADREALNDCIIIQLTQQLLIVKCLYRAEITCSRLEMGSVA